MSKKNGTDCLIYLMVSSSPQPIGGSTDNTLTVDGSVIDITTKDSGAWKEKLGAGKLDWKMNGKGLYDDAEISFDDLLVAMINRQRVMVRFSTEISGETYHEGYGYFTHVEKTAPLEQGCGFSYDIEGDGPITPGIA